MEQAGLAMRKSILMMLLAVVSSSAAAEWVEVDRTESETAYADSTTIRRRGDMVKMWSLFDLKTLELANGKPYMSQREQREYDCKEELTRMLHFSLHGANMGGGTVVHVGPDPGKWTPVAPGSIAESLWKFACGKR
jgi:surface-adhesin protein E